MKGRRRAEGKIRENIAWKKRERERINEREKKMEEC